MTTTGRCHQAPVDDNGLMSLLGRVLRVALVAGVVSFSLAPLVPYGWQHPNPPVTAEPAWPSPGAEQLARAACFDCHSNETDWPPYSYVAPMSWLVRQDVEDGRDELNFSEWDDDADDAAEAIADGSMPPRRYRLLHPDARLSPDERRSLISAFEAMDDARDGDRDGDRGRG